MEVAVFIEQLLPREHGRGTGTFVPSRQPPPIPCPIWSGPYPRVMPDQLLALGARVGEGVVIAGHAVGAIVRLNIFAAIQGLAAFCTDMMVLADTQKLHLC